MRIQLVIGFFNLFKASLGKNSEEASPRLLGLGAEHRECGYLFHDS